jgi:hypothetical protein
VVLRYAMGLQVGSLLIDSLLFSFSFSVVKVFFNVVAGVSQWRRHEGRTVGQKQPTEKASSWHFRLQHVEGINNAVAD